MSEASVLKGYEYARDAYAAAGVDADSAMARCADIAVSMHCWQGDDVTGFEGAGGGASGGIATTGNYPGRARTPDELRADMDLALRLIPGRKNLNLHASYAEFGGNKVDRDSITIDHFTNWVDWAKRNGMGIDFNPTYFSHPYAEDGFTISSSDAKRRAFWIEHGKRCREIAEGLAKRLGLPSVVNFWMPDGYKDVPADTAAPRERMVAALDEIFADKSIDCSLVIDAVESKLFGLGVESYTVGSHELLLGYAIARGKAYTLDAGHYHPTEYISAKISSVLQFVDKVLLHVSRGVRWDSDHVIVYDDELRAIMTEIVRNGFEKRVYIGLDYFDASINRIAAWVVGMRNVQKALLNALLEPYAAFRDAEREGDLSTRLALAEEAKTMPFRAVWDEYCRRQGVPVGGGWLRAVKDYERDEFPSRA